MAFVNEKTLECTATGKKKAPPLWGEALKAFIFGNFYSALAIETSFTMPPSPCTTSTFTMANRQNILQNLQLRETKKSGKKT